MLLHLSSHEWWVKTLHLHFPKQELKQLPAWHDIRGWPAHSISKHRHKLLGLTGKKTEAKIERQKRRYPVRLNFITVSLAVCYREKNQCGNLNDRWEFQTVSFFFSSPPSPLSFAFSMYFPRSSGKIKNDSGCSVKYMGGSCLGR